MILAIGIVDLFISLAVLGLALFVIMRNRDRRINQLFGGVVLSLAVWIMASSMSDLSAVLWENEIQALFWARAAIIGPFFFCAFFLYFTYFFPHDGHGLSKLKTALIFSAPVLILPLVLTQYNVESVRLKYWGTDFTPGILYTVLLICLISYFTAAFYNLIIKYKRGDSFQKAQIFYVIAGAAFVLIIGTISNLIFPVYFGDGRLSVLGPSLAMLMFTFLTAYAILVHHLLDVWIVIRLGTIFALVFAVISFIYIGGVSILTQYIGSTISLLAASLLITLSFEPLKRFVEDKTDRIFFKKHYKMDEVIGELTSVVHKIELNIDKILSAFNEIIVKHFKARSVATAVLTPGGSFISKQFFHDGSNNRHFELYQDNPLVSFLAANPNFLINRDELIRNLQTGSLVLPVDDIELIPGLLEEMEGMDFALALPIKSRDQLIGIYFVGDKKSNDLFTYQDIKLLDHLTGEIGAFIDNARLYEDLKRLDEAKSNFISVVSHQLRTPLSAMRWDTELLLDGKINKKTREEFLRDTYKNSLFMISHLDDMLIALDIEDREVHLDKAECNIEDLIDEILEEHKPMIGQKKLKLEISLIEPAKKLFADCKKIKKVFAVLLVNAINYAPADVGEVKVNSREKSEHDKKCVEFSIADNGIGISGDEQRYMFQKFFRGENAKKMSPNGFGLGLFITKSFIESHGGSVNFESSGRDKGTIFYFTVPIE